MMVILKMFIKPVPYLCKQFTAISFDLEEFADWTKSAAASTQQVFQQIDFGEQKRGSRYPIKFDQDFSKWEKENGQLGKKLHTLFCFIRRRTASNPNLEPHL